MAIRPIDLPSAAGLEYGKGDVRHFSEGDSVSVPGISNPTRHLAERDNQLRDKINEVIGIVNNTEQFVPLPLVRTSLAPNDEVVAANYRIPVGFEARVLNATVSAVPASTDIALIIYYNEGFGGSTGTEVVSTASEFTGGVQFYSAGEFIVVMRNTGTAPLDFASSVLLTLRPLGAQGTLLVGSTVQGDQGLPGPQGPPGPVGPSGSGGTGSPGMLWKGPWTPGGTYNPNDVVSYTTPPTTGIVSSYICVIGNNGAAGTEPHPNPPYTYWQPVAIGSKGADGAPGTTTPGTGTTEFPTYSDNDVEAQFFTGADWVGLGMDGYDGGSSEASHNYPISVKEVSVQSSALGTGGTAKGFCCLNGRFPIAFTGSGTLTLPNKTVGGAKIDYKNGFINFTAVANGTSKFDDPTVPNRGFVDLCTTMTITGGNEDQYVVKVRNPDPIRVMFVLSGVQPIPYP